MHNAVRGEAISACEMTIGMAEVDFGEAKPIRIDLSAAVQKIFAVEVILREEFRVSFDCERTVERGDPWGVESAAPRSRDFGDPPTFFVEIDG